MVPDVSLVHRYGLSLFSRPLLVPDISNLKSIRRIKLYGVQTMFKLGICYLPNFFSNEVPGRELWVNKSL